MNGDATRTQILEHWLPHVLANSPVVHYMLPIAGDRRRLSWVSDSVTARFGYAPHECLALDWWHDCVHPHDRTAASGQWPALRWAERVVAEYRFRRADGSYRWVRDEMQRTRDGDGHAEVCVGAWSDLTEAHHAGQDLAQAEAHYHGIVEASPYGIAIVQDGRIGYANPACLETFGFDNRDVVVGRFWHTLVAADDVPMLRDCLGACCRGEPVPSHLRWRGVCHGGRHIWMESAWAPLAWQGRPAVVWFFIDRSERKTREDQVRQSQMMEAISLFIASVAHDFNNQLTLINGYSELLRETLTPSDDNRTLVAELHAAGARAAQLVGQLQLLSGTQKPAAMPSVLDPATVIASLEHSLRHTLGSAIRLETVRHSTRRVRLAGADLDRILTNLVFNARDAMPHGGKLTIETLDVDMDAAAARLRPDMVPGPYVLLAVSDTGCGIAADVRARIFEPYFTTKGATGGTGLGLSTVYGLVKRAGGHVSVASDANQGATFKILLPAAADEAGDGVPVGITVPAERGNETVLVVDDESSVRSLLRELLQGYGYRVLVAQDGNEAIGLCEDAPGPIHLLVTDVIMPKLGGRQLAEAARKRRPHLRVLYVSGDADEAVESNGVLNQDVYFLQKPFTKADLARKVRDALDH